MKLQGSVLPLVMSPRSPLLDMAGGKMDYVSSQQFLCGKMLDTVLLKLEWTGHTTLGHSGCR